MRQNRHFGAQRYHDRWCLSADVSALILQENLIYLFFYFCQLVLLGVSGKETGCTWRISHIKQSLWLTRFSFLPRILCDYCSPLRFEFSLSFSLTEHFFICFLSHSLLHSANYSGSPVLGRLHTDHGHGYMDAWSWPLATRQGLSLSLSLFPIMGCLEGEDYHACFFVSIVKFSTGLFTYYILLK